MQRASAARMASALPSLRPCCRPLQRLGRCQLSARRANPASCIGLDTQTSNPHSSNVRMLSSVSMSPPHVKPDLERLRRQQPKVIRDYLMPMPSHLLTTTLSDLEVCGARTNTSEEATLTTPASPDVAGPLESTPVVQAPPVPLPQGHHLVYFPIQAAPSHLAPDGADMDHSPGVHYSRRLWAGGEVVFRGATDGSPVPDEVLLDGQPWTCTETIGDVRVKESNSTLTNQGDEKVFVDLWRRYALGHDPSGDSRPWAIEERRTLVFMNPDADTPRDSIPKIIKCEFSSNYRPGPASSPSPKEGGKQVSVLTNIDRF